MDLGLTSVQARVYVAIYELGSAEISAIAKHSNVDRADVYRVKCKLQQLGLIEQEISYPIKEKAIPIETALNILLNRKHKEYTELKSKINSLIKEHKKNHFNQRSFFEESKFVMIPSREALFNKLLEAINNSNVSIDACTSYHSFIFACSSFNKALNRAWLRGVKGRAVIEKSDESVFEIVKDSWKSPFADLRFIPNIPKTVLVMYDKKEVFIFVEPKAELQESAALWTNNPCLISMAASYFEILWATSMETSQYHLDISHT